MDLTNICETPSGRYAFRVTIAYREGDEWIKKSRIITTRDWRGTNILAPAFRGYYDDRSDGPRLEAIEYLGEGFDVPSEEETE